MKLKTSIERMNNLETDQSELQKYLGVNHELWEII